MCSSPVYVWNHLFSQSLLTRKSKSIYWLFDETMVWEDMDENSALYYDYRYRLMEKSDYVCFRDFAKFINILSNRINSILNQFRAITLIKRN